MNWFRRKIWDLKNLSYQHDIHAERNIRLLRESELFDSDYYLERYPDVADSDVSPEKHYYFYGWREGRDPSARFDNDYYLRENHLHQNPLVHYLTVGKDDPAIKVATDLDTASNLVKKYFQVCAPLCTMPVADRPPCLNVCFTGFDKSCFFGGKATALVLAVQYANTCGCALRIIAQQPEAEIFGEFLELFSLDRPATSLFTRSGRASGSRSASGTISSARCGKTPIPSCTRPTSPAAFSISCRRSRPSSTTTATATCAVTRRSPTRA